MQLAILIAMLMLVRQNGYAQIKPIIEEFGGEEGKLAIKQAEELNQIISTVNSFTSVQTKGVEQTPKDETPLAGEPHINTEQTTPNRHPLDPIKNIADDSILSALSKYVAVGE